MLHYRFCPECEQEFRPDILQCSDCGAALEERWEDEDGEVRSTLDASTPAPTPAPQIDLQHFRPLVTNHVARLLVPHAERLKEHGIPFHLGEVVADAESRVAAYHILVHEDDRERGLEALADLIDDTADAHLLSAVERRFEEGRGYVECPACGTSLPQGAAECPECGLAMGPAMDLPPCPSCGAPLAPGEERCGGCGTETPKTA